MDGHFEIPASQRTIGDILPSGVLDGAQDNRMLSDHALRISSIPVGSQLINAGTYNMLAFANIFPGFHYPSPDTRRSLRDLLPTDDGYEAWQKHRWENMCNYAKQVIENRELSLFSIQESTPALRSMLLEKLNANLPENEQWAFYAEPGDNYAPLAVLYNKSEFRLEAEEIIKLDGAKCPCVTLTHLKSQEKIQAVAVTIGHRQDEDPSVAQRDLLACAERNGGQKMIALGDFNLRMANPVAELTNSANNLVPPNYRRMAGIYDSTDAILVVEKKGITQLPSETIDELNPDRNIAKIPNFNATDQESPYRRVFNPTGHVLPIGSGMNAQQFVGKLIKDPAILSNVSVEIYARVQTNEKQLCIKSNFIIPVLEQMGVSYDHEKQGYVIEFAYPEIDKVMPLTNSQNFYLRDANKNIMLASLTNTNTITPASVISTDNSKDHDGENKKFLMAGNLYDLLEKNRCFQNIEQSTGDRKVDEENLLVLLETVKGFMAGENITEPKQIRELLVTFNQLYSTNREMTAKTIEAISSVMKVYSGSEAHAPKVPERKTNPQILSHRLLDFLENKHCLVNMSFPYGGSFDDKLEILLDNVKNFMEIYNIKDLKRSNEILHNLKTSYQSHPEMTVKGMEAIDLILKIYVGKDPDPVSKMQL